MQLVTKFPAFHGTRRFITALTNVGHLSLSLASPIQSIYPHPTSWRSILILSTHLRLGLPSGLFPSGFPNKTLYSPSPHSYAPHAQPISFFSILSPAHYWVRLPLITLLYSRILMEVTLLKPTGYVMHHQFNIQQLYALPTLYLCVLYLSENKQRLVPLTA